MNTVEQNRYIEFALSGICSSCGQPMPPIPQETINEKLDECEDDQFECGKCTINFLIGVGWDLEMFKECLPDLLSGEYKDYILSACACSNPGTKVVEA